MGNSDMKFEEAERLSELMAKKAFGSLTAEENQELEQWAGSSERRREYAGLMGNPEFIDGERRRRQAIDTEEALRAMKERIEESDGTAHRPAWMAVAASVLLLLASGLAAWWLNSPKTEAPVLSHEVQTAIRMSRETGRNEALIEPQSLAKTASGRNGRASWVDEKLEKLADDALRVTTHMDKEYWLRLEDGTYVHLNYNTRIIYPEHFSGGTRDVILDGEAYFMVAHDSRHPFIVHTPQGDVRQYGTEFNVSTRGTGGKVSVVLVRGSIGVTPADGVERMMKPGEKMEVDGAHTRVEKVDTEPYEAWNTGYFAFRYQPLWKVAEVIEKWYDTDVKFLSPKLRDITVVGDFDRYESLDNILNALSKSTGTEIEHRGRSILISK